MFAITLRSPVLAPYLGFAVFGAFWGTWGASIPAIRAQASLNDGQLGTALLFIGVGALPSMLLAGRAVDRFGQRASAVFIATLGAVGLVAAIAARDQVSLSIGLTALGVASGATDVAINAAASSAQTATASPAVSRSHGIFSVAVVVFSLGTGGLLAFGAPVAVPFAVLAATATAAASVLTQSATSSPPVADQQKSHRPGVDRRWGTLGWGSLAVIGGLSALAFATENAHQSWSAIYLGDVLYASPALAATGPAIFAAVVAFTRFSTARLGVAHPILTVTAGALTAASGTMILALSTTIGVGLIGLAIAAAGTAVLYPTLVSALSAHLSNAVRGRAISIVATIAYAGFLTGPVYVGSWANAQGLPTAMIAVAGLAALLAAMAPLALRATLGRQNHTTEDRTTTASTAELAEGDR